MQLPPDWSEFLSVLRRHGVRFLVVGAHALAAHGRPRATQDLDVLVAPTAANARKVGAALAEFGFTKDVPITASQMGRGNATMAGIFTPSPR